ncbi:Laminin-like protein lam-2, partial [Bienertia sinuspersici]
MRQQQQINTEQPQQNIEASTEHESTSPRLTYRQKRRLKQAELRLKFPDRKRRGPTRGKKYGPRIWNSNFEENIRFNFMDELRCVVGEKADEFICDCSNWVKEYFPLDSWPMDVASFVTIGMVRSKRLMRHQLNQLKNLIDRLSLMKLNKILCTSPDLRRQKSTTLYLHKGSGWEPNAEKDYKALKRLHEKEEEKHGEDTLSVKDAYMEVFKQKSGYVKGLGPGARPPKRCRADGETNEARTSLSLEIQKLKDNAAAREASLVSEIETLKESNNELNTSKEELIASNDELKATVSRINIEAIKREKKLRDDMMKMFEQM